MDEVLLHSVASCKAPSDASPGECTLAGQAALTRLSRTPVTGSLSEKAGALTTRQYGPKGASLLEDPTSRLVAANAGSIQSPDQSAAVDIIGFGDGRIIADSRSLQNGY